LEKILHDLSKTCVVSYVESLGSERLVGVGLILISCCSPQQLYNKVGEFVSGPVIGCIERNFTGRLRKGQPSGLTREVLHQPRSNSAWHRVRHCSVGGATEFVALFYVVGMELDPQVSSLRRTIRHFVDFGIRPSRGVAAPSPNPIPSSTSYELGDRLRPENYFLPVTCPSTFHATGWGLRTLTINELAAFHGLPRKSSDFAYVVSDIQWPPVQLLDSVFMPAWDVLGHQVQPVFCRQQVVGDISEEPAYSWLPQLGRFCHMHGLIQLSSLLPLARVTMR
jgi:hypothetical protein